jgi:hypothetical protein
MKHISHLFILLLTSFIVLVLVAAPTLFLHEKHSCAGH